MQQIIELRAAVVERLQRRLAPCDVREHPRAEFTTADLDSCLKARHVAVRVAFSGVPEPVTWSSEEAHIPCAFAIYVATKDGAGTADGGRGIARDMAAIAAVTAIMAVIADGEWSVENTLKIRSITASQMYGGEVDARSAMVWSVSFRQTLIVPCDPSANDALRPFLELITHYDLVPADGTYEATDTIPMRSP